MSLLVSLLELLSLTHHEFFTWYAQTQNVQAQTEMQGGIFTLHRARTYCGSLLKQKACSPLSKWYCTLIAVQIVYSLLMAVRLLRKNALKPESAGGSEIAV